MFTIVIALKSPLIAKFITFQSHYNNNKKYYLPTKYVQLTEFSVKQSKQNSPKNDQLFYVNWDGKRFCFKKVNTCKVKGMDT